MTRLSSQSDRTLRVEPRVAQKTCDDRASPTKATAASDYYSFPPGELRPRSMKHLPQAIRIVGYVFIPDREPHQIDAMGRQRLADPRDARGLELVVLDEQQICVGLVLFGEPLRVSVEVAP